MKHVLVCISRCCMDVIVNSTDNNIWIVSVVLIMHYLYSVNRLGSIIMWTLLQTY